MQQLHMFAIQPRVPPALQGEAETEVAELSTRWPSMWSSRLQVGAAVRK